MHYQKHIFFCTNLKTEGKKCCQQNDGQAWSEYTRKKLISLSLHGEGKVRVSSSGCLGRCKLGPNIVIYPDQVWYHYQSQADIDEIIEQHIVNGKIVEHLLIDQTLS